MPSRVVSQRGSTEMDDWWTDHLTTCANSGVGYSTNISYHRHNGLPTHDHDMEDQSFRISHELSNKKIRLYGVFDGFEEGKRVSDFAAQRMVAEILLDEMLERAHTDEEIKWVLRQAFITVDSGYFRSIDELLAKRIDLQSKVAGVNISEATQKDEDLFTQISALDHQVLGGSTAVVALIVDNRLFIANCGDSRAILVKADNLGQLTVFQVSKQHDTNDRDEQLRLNRIGLSEDDIRHFGVPYCTRCIGDYRRKAGYKEVEHLSKAASDPVISEPEVQGGFLIDESFRFLILMSSGVCTALEESADDSSQPPNATIAGLVATEFCQQKSLNGVAQAVIDCIARNHQEAFIEGKLKAPTGHQKREDMTLLVCNFHQPLPMASRGHLPSFSGPHMDPFLAFVRPPTVVTDFATADSETLRGTNALTIGSAYSSAGDDDDSNPIVLPLDSNGCIAPYVSFDQYDKHPDRARIEAEIQQLMESFSASRTIKEEVEPADEEQVHV
uniref:PPM-type phosphatase domain-containing protein n=1 Tax=Plectus sambesii TaxID=2011161 RepID=A0A914WJ16_9BILA